MKEEDDTMLVVFLFLGVLSAVGGTWYYLERHRLQNQSESLLPPVPLSFPLTSRFGQRGSEFHNGIDVGVPVGTPIIAPASGLVERVYVSGAGGNQLIIKHDNGYTTGYAHLSDTLVWPGSRIRQGQTVALSGNTGRSTGPHLHFTLRYQGELIDPLKVFGYA